MRYTFGRGSALAASGTAIAAVMALVAILLANRGDEPAAFVVPSAIGFLGPMVAASAIAILGAVKRSRPLWMISGTALGLTSITAFSGVTLILLVPSVLLFYAAARRDDRRRSERRSIKRWFVVVLGAAATAPVLVFLLTRVGVIGFVVALTVTLVAGVLRGAVARTAQRPNTADVARFAAIVGLLIGAVVVLYGRTEQICWERLETASGPVESVGPGSPTGEMVLTGPAEGGCGPVPTVDGLALGLLLLGLSVGLAAAARGEPSVRSERACL